MDLTSLVNPLSVDICQITDIYKVQNLFRDGFPTFTNWDNVVQGAVGDCWLLGPMAALAKNPILRTQVFIPQFRIEGSNYIITLFDVNSIRHDITINGELLVMPAFKKYKADLLFAGRTLDLPSKPKQLTIEQLWPSFIEKAAATLKGSYCPGLDGGDIDDPNAKQASDGFMLLSGRTCTTIIMDHSIDIKSIFETYKEGAITITTKHNSFLSIENKLKEIPEDENFPYNLLHDHVYTVQQIDDTQIYLYNAHGHRIQSNIALPIPFKDIITYFARIDVLLPINKGGNVRKTRKTRKARKNKKMKTK